MRYIKIFLLTLFGFNLNAQIELFQLDWALDSNYVIGALPSGEPTWVLKSSLTDSSYILSVVSDSSTVVENDYGTIIVESPANTYGVTVDSSLYMTTYDGTLKENYITPGTTSQYWRGDKTWQTLNTSIVPELTNLYYTDARARAALSLTVSGSSGASTYNNTTGVLNVPTYTLAGLGGFALPSLTNGSVLFSNGTTISQDNANFFFNNTYDQLGIGTASPNTYIYDGYNGLGIYDATSARIGMANSSRAWLQYLYGSDFRIFNSTNGETFKISGTDSKWQGGAYTSTGTNKAAYFDTGGVLQRGDYDVLDGVGIAGYVARWADTNTQSTGGLYFPVEGSMQMGLGTTNPNGYTGDGHPSLAIYGATSARFALANSSGSWLQYLDGTGFKLWHNSWGDLLTATSTGRIGINTTSPSVSFHVAGNSRFTGSVADGNNDVGSYGQVLSSTVSGTDWITLPAETGDISAVTVSAPVTGGGTSGSVNIGVDTTASTPSALATQFDLLGKQATLVSGTNIKTVNSNSLVGSGNVSVGTVTSITAAAPLTGGAITTSGTIGVDTTATTGSALATQFDISTKWTGSGSGTSGQATYWNGTSSIAGSPNFLWTNADSMLTTRNLTVGRRDLTATTIAGWSSGGVATGMTQGHGITISGGTLRSSRFTVDGTNWFSGDLYFKTENVGTSPAWVYAGGDVKFRMPAATNGQVLKSNGTNWIVGTDNDTDTDAQNLTTPSWNTGTGVLTTGISGGSGTTIDLDGRYLTAEVDGSTTNEIQGLSYNTGTRALGITSGSGVTLPLVTSIIPGLVSAYPNNTTSFLRGDGTWATPPTPSVTGTAPILVTSGNISLNYGTGLANSGGQLVTYNPTGSIYSSSDTSPETFDTSYEIVNMGNSAVSPGTDISYGTNNISITSASAAGRYQISYNCCHDVAANNTITYSIFIEGSEMSPNPSKIEIETQNGIRNCVSKTFLTTLANGDTVDLRLKLTGMVTGNAYGNANLTIIKI